MTSDKIWWYAKGNKRHGPLTAAELKAMAANGQLAATDRVWKEGLENWVPASSVQRLFADSAPVTAPPISVSPPS